MTLRINTNESYRADIARIQALDDVERMAATGRPFCVVECVSWTDKTPLTQVQAVQAVAEATPAPVKRTRSKVAPVAPAE